MSAEFHLPLLRAIGVALAAVLLVAAHYFQTARTERWLAILLGVTGGVVIVLSLFLKEAWISVILEYLAGWQVISTVCVLLYGALLIPIFRQAARAKSLNEKETEFVFRSVEICVLVVGVCFAFHEAGRAIEALKQNTQSNKLSVRGQLYQADNRLSEHESLQSDGKLLVLYADSEPECRDAREAHAYVTHLLSLATSDPRIINARSADELYDSIFSADSFAKFDPEHLTNERGDVVELRRMSAHCVLILDLLHSAYDYCGEKVISETEFRTWSGYLDDLGPNPVFLATLRNWERHRYMSKGFAKYVQHKLYIDAAEGVRRVIQEFYPDLSHSDFADNMPDYGDTNWQNLIDEDKLADQHEASARMARLERTNGPSYLPASGPRIVLPPPASATP